MTNERASEIDKLSMLEFALLPLKERIEYMAHQMPEDQRRDVMKGLEAREAAKSGDDKEARDD